MYWKSETDLHRRITVAFRIPELSERYRIPITDTVEWPEWGDNPLSNWPVREMIDIKQIVDTEIRSQQSWLNL